MIWVVHPASVDGLCLAKPHLQGLVQRKRVDAFSSDYFLSSIENPYLRSQKRVVDLVVDLVGAVGPQILCAGHVTIFLCGP
jgi:hypothetical protein